MHRAPILTSSRILLTAAFLGAVTLGVVLLETGSQASAPCQLCDVPEEEWDKLPPEKRADQERLKRKYEQAAQQALAPAEPPPTPAPPPPLREGIYDIDVVPLVKNFRISNHWNGTQGPERLQVYAGSLITDPSQGFVVVRLLRKDSSPVTSHPTPERAGAVRIVNVEAGRLTLVSTSGKVWVFDARTRVFEDAGGLPEWPSGIFAEGEAPFPAGQPFPNSAYTVTNVWQGRIGAEYVRLFAGSYLRDSAQGIVIVQRVPVDLTVAPGLAVTKVPPVKSGALRILSVANGRAVLTSASGPAVDFDLASQTFSPR